MISLDSSLNRIQISRNILFRKIVKELFTKNDNIFFWQPAVSCIS